jgi:hypothetical protein
MNANEKGERRCQKAAAELGVILCIKWRVEGHAKNKDLLALRCNIQGALKTSENYTASNVLSYKLTAQLF